MHAKIYSAATAVVLSLLVAPCLRTSSQETKQQADKKYFKGNEIEFGMLKVIPYDYRETIAKQRAMFLYADVPESVMVKDPRTGLLKTEKVTADIMPVALNGKPIIGNEQRYMLTDEKRYIAPFFTGAGASFDDYLFKQLKKELDQLEDGAYILDINKLVVDDKGQIAYYQSNGIGLIEPNDQKPAISVQIKNTIDQKLTMLLNGPVQFQPALSYGKPVNARLNTGNYQIVVQGHNASLVARGGC